MVQITKIIKRNGTIVGYDRARIANAILKATASTGHSNPKLADAMAEKVESALAQAATPASVPSVEDIQDVVENVLMANGQAKVARNYIIYRHERAKVRAKKQALFEITDNVPYRKLYEVLLWNLEHRCESVEAINRLIAKKQFPDLVREADQRYSDEIKTAASHILENAGRIRIVIIAGPSSSGKTTTTIKVSEHLATSGIGFKAINIDHYFFNLDRHPRDEFGDYDYERPEALDIELINDHLMKLLNGEMIRTPHYDFKSGLRKMDVHELKLADNEILLIDSLHGLYDNMTASIPADRKFRLYIETLGQIRAADGTFMRWADNRLLRRMSRDKDHRNLKPLETLTHWHYVRRSELKYIIPFIKHADFVLNSALPYELPILKKRLFRYLKPAVTAYSGDPKRLDAHIRANRVYALLKPLRMVRDESCIPPDSLLREFIGGSRYKY